MGPVQGQKIIYMCLTINILRDWKPSEKRESSRRAKMTTNMRTTVKTTMGTTAKTTKMQSGYKGAWKMTSKGTET